jgi:hypothetical protein
MTAIRQQPVGYTLYLVDALRFAMTFVAGLVLTWVVSLALTAASARANDQPAGQTPSAGDYVMVKNAGMGSGLLESSLGHSIRRAAPVASEPSNNRR